MSAAPAPAAAPRPTSLLDVAAIQVDGRLREDMGDLYALAASIERFGLLHPIVIDDGGRLIAGARRLAAVKILRWKEVPVRRLGELTAAERREIELEENLRRKDLTSYERSKLRVEYAETAREILREEAELRPKSGRKGRPKEAGSLRDGEARAGVQRETLHKARHHVETADAFPFMRGPAWKQDHVLRARDAIEKLPAPERPRAAALLSEQPVPIGPRDALKVIGNLAEKKPAERSEIYQLHRSNDSRDRSLALTKAAATEPVPDPRRALLGEAIELAVKAKKMFPNDPCNPVIGEAIKAVDKAMRAIQEASKR